MSNILDHPELPSLSRWMSSSEYQQTFDKKLKERAYPERVEGRCDLGKTQYRAAFTPFPQGRFYFYSYHGKDKAYFDKRNGELDSKGFRLTSSSRFECAGRKLYQGTWIKTG